MYLGNLLILVGLCSFHLPLALARPSGDFGLVDRVDNILDRASSIVRESARDAAVAASADLAEKSCQHGPQSRNCWGRYSVDTNSYRSWPSTGKVREYNFDVVNQTLAPDGYVRQTLSFNGRIPGPAITADWGDYIKVTINNKLTNNATAIHFHGLRQLRSNEMDGVPGVTQCPIAPGQSMVYYFQATEYGTSWYHSHDTLQYSDGLFGPLLINGPSSANYDVDTGVTLVNDWAHKSAFTEWWQGGRTFSTPAGGVANALINGTNTFSPCKNSTDVACVGSGSRWNYTLVPGKKHLFRIVNTATNGFFRFSVDNHNLTVIATDFVPITPYSTDSIVVAIGQRYDIILEANQVPGNYWLRTTWQQSCAPNAAPDGVRGILTYQGTSVATPNTTTAAVPDSCDDPPPSSLVPRVQIPVPSSLVSHRLDMSYNATPIFNGGYFRWYINGSDMVANWSAPTIAKQALNMEGMTDTNNGSNFVNHDNAVHIPEQSGWSIWIIQDHTNTAVHPLHIHGHDFWILGQLPGIYQPGAESQWNLQNPPRRDTAGLPKGGYLALAVQVDNPGAWLFHCHVPWHTSQGLSVQFLELDKKVQDTIKNPSQIYDTCKNWYRYRDSPANIYPQEDSGL